MNKTIDLTQGNTFEEALIALLNQMKATEDNAMGNTVDATYGETAEQTKDNKQQFIKDNSEQWKEIGLKYKQWRESRYLSKSEVARNIGVAPSTLTKFEDGLPCKLAKTIEAGYKMVMELQCLYKLIEMHESTLDKTQKHADSLEQSFVTITKMITQRLQNSEVLN